jgi:Protein of unknown function (DUF3089)
MEEPQRSPFRWTSLLAASAAVITLGTAACSSGGVTVPATTADASGTVWLCRPGLPSDPCTVSTQSTIVPARGPRRTTALGGALRATFAAQFACFYVYPTASEQQTANANLTVETPEVDAAIAQAAPFSRVCSVWAPMYRQQTSATVQAGLAGDTPLFQSSFAVAFRSLLAGWRDFLTHDDRDRPIILIGDSQGSAILIHLIATQLDDDPAVLHRLVVAIIAGGNLQVPTGKTVGATFKHVPECTRAAQTGCVIAYSSFPAKPPPDALFGWPGQGVSLQSGQTAQTGQQVACVNPAALGGGTADLSPYFPTVSQPGLSPTASTPWVTYPDLYSASCQTAGGASWLQVTSLGAHHSRPVVTEPLGPEWGYHVDDVGLALGNLIRDVAAAEQAWLNSPPL